MDFGFDGILKEEERRLEGCTLKYRLSCETSRKVSSFGLRLYSIRIELSDGESVTSSDAKEIFSDGGKAVCFFNKLVNELATPLDLAYILEDDF